MNLPHHANLIVGNAQTRDQLISTLEKKHKIIAQGNPDFFIRNYETFTIDDAREIKLLHSTRPVGGDSEKRGTAKKIFILTMNGATVEAQNAMLKLLEEPAEYAHFFLIVPSAHLLLPTVKSRMSEMELEEGSKKNDGKSTRDALATKSIDEARAFLKATQTKRLDIVKKLVDEISKEKKTKQDAIIFLDAVQEIVYTEKGVKNGKSSLEAIETARNYLNDRAPSVKMLLEYVALSV
jgi:DNA polymerase III delta prime subunit